MKIDRKEMIMFRYITKPLNGKQKRRFSQDYLIKIKNYERKLLICQRIK